MSSVIALVFRYDVRDAAVRARLRPEGRMGAFFRRARGYIGTELLRDVEEPDRYIVVDRWETIDAYNAFLGEHQAEYLERSDDSACTTCRSCASARSRRLADDA